MELVKLREYELSSMKLINVLCYVLLKVKYFHSVQFHLDKDQDCCFIVYSSAEIESRWEIKVPLNIFVFIPNLKYFHLVDSSRLLFYCTFSYQDRETFRKQTFEWSNYGGCIIPYESWSLS